MKEYKYLVDDSNVSNIIDKLFRERGYKANRLIDEKDGKDIEEYVGSTLLFGIIHVRSRQRFFGTTTSPKTEIILNLYDVDMRVESRLVEAIEKAIANFKPYKIT